jgi:hypothetical protein
MRLVKLLSGMVGLAALAPSLLALASPPSVSLVGSKWKVAIATVFWVGEEPAPDNGFITNVTASWDHDWVASFGGVDQPNSRCGFRPCGFTPKENAFYVALPYDDLTDEGVRKRSAAVVPWNRPGAKMSLLKNRWIAVQAREVVCYGQWEDAGPFEEDDAAYVFGDAPEPLNKRGVSAGIDLSPAMRDCLGVGPVARVMWRHVEAEQVPGP